MDPKIEQGTATTLTPASPEMKIKVGEPQLRKNVGDLDLGEYEGYAYALSLLVRQYSISRAHQKNLMINPDFRAMKNFIGNLRRTRVPDDQLNALVKEANDLASNTLEKKQTPQEVWEEFKKVTSDIHKRYQQAKIIEEVEFYMPWISKARRFGIPFGHIINHLSPMGLTNVVEDVRALRDSRQGKKDQGGDVYSVTGLPDKKAA